MTKYLFRFILIAAVYYLSGKLGFLFLVPPGISSALWPPAGVGLACLFLFGRSFFFSILFSAFLLYQYSHSHFVHMLSFPDSLLAAICLSIASAAQAWIGNDLIRREFQNPTALSKQKDVIRFLLLAALSCLVTPVVSTGLLISHELVTFKTCWIPLFISYAGECFGVFIFLPLIFVFFAEPKPIWLNRRHLIAVPMMIAFIALIVSFNFLKKLEAEHIKINFEKQIETIHQLLEREIFTHISILYSVESFYASSKEVDRNEFALFVTRFIENHSGVETLQWVPRVLQKDLVSFESSLIDGTSHVSVYDENELGQKMPASGKEEYYPILYVEPFKENHNAMGLNLASKSELEEVLPKARDWGVAVAATLSRYDEKTQKLAQRLMIFLPIYKNGLPHQSLEARRENLTGFLVGEFNINEIVQGIVNRFENNKFILEAYDITKLVPMTLTNEGRKTIFNRAHSLIGDEQRAVKVARFLNVAGERWELDYLPTAEYLREQQSSNLWFVLLGAVSFVGLLSVFLLIISGRTSEIEQLVKEKTDELRLREERFDLTVQGSSDGLWDWQDLQKDEEWWSSRFYELLGYSPQEIKPSHKIFMDLVHEADRETVVNTRHQHFETGKPYDVEIRLCHKSGQYRWYRMRGKGYRNEMGHFYRMAGTLQDITEQKESETALKEEKQKALDLSAIAHVAARSKTDFLSNMSHEIRTPMNAILGFTELLSKTTLNDKQKIYLETIQSSGKLLLEVVNDLFDFSRIDKGRIKLEHIAFDLEYLIHDVMEVVAPKLKELPVSTYVEIDQHVPRKLIGDPTRIRQILLNLVGNAIKFTRQGEIGIRVDLGGEMLNENVTLRFSVRDTGIGIPKEKHQAIFESFTHAESATLRRNSGLGIGLTICRKMVELMGGEIKVDSEEGRGSEFIFTLKLQREMNTKKVQYSQLLKDELRKKSAFILDSNRKSQEILYQYCQELGIDVVGVADSGKGALNKLDDLAKQGKLPDVILCETLMSGMEPELFIEKMYSHEECRNIKMICVTSDAQPGGARRAQNAGFHGYLSKPVTRKDIESVIRVLLSPNSLEEIIVTRHMVEEISCKGIKVLVAEDNPTDRQLLKAMFENLECDGEFVQNGQAAVEKLKTGSFDVCFLDIKMPVMDGIQTAKMIRATISKDLPLVALTVRGSQEDHELCLQAGMNYFVTKPVEMSELAEVINRYGRKTKI
jgi:PAS domain S-box-containing protein